MNYEKIYELINNVNIKNSYNILEAVLRLIDIDLFNSQKYDIKTNVNIFRRKLANDLIQKKLYKNFPNKLKFERNNIYSKLINNEDCDENIYKYKDEVIFREQNPKLYKSFNEKLNKFK